MFRWALLIVVALCGVASAEPFDPVPQVRQWLWPSKAAPAPVPLPPAKPVAIAPAIVPASPIVSPPAVPAIVAPPSLSQPTRESVPARAIHSEPPRAKPRVTKPERSERAPHKPATATAPTKSRTSYPCGQIGLGISIFGVDGMKSKARERGYSERQISEAQRACGY